jgi:hypothetical protein
VQRRGPLADCQSVTYRSFDGNPSTIEIARICIGSNPGVGMKKAPSLGLYYSLVCSSIHALSFSIVPAFFVGVPLS